MTLTNWTDDFSADHIANGDYSVMPWSCDPGSVQGYSISGSELQLSGGEYISILDRRAPIVPGWQKVTVEMVGTWSNPAGSGGGDPDGTAQLMIGLSMFAGLSQHTFGGVADGVGYMQYNPDDGTRPHVNNQRGFSAGLLFGGQSGVIVNNNQLWDFVNNIFPGSSQQSNAGMPVDTTFDIVAEFWPDGNVTFTFIGPTATRIVSTIWPSSEDHDLGFGPYVVDARTTRFHLPWIKPVHLSGGGGDVGGNVHMDLLMASFAAGPMYPGFAFYMGGTDTMTLSRWHYDIEYRHAPPAIPLVGSVVLGDYRNGLHAVGARV